MGLSTIEVARTHQYSSDVYMLARQMKSKFASRVRHETITNAKDAYFDRLGKADVQKMSTRHGATPLNEIPNSRRRVTMADYNTSTILDRQDQFKMLIDPTNKYTVAQAAGLGDQMDDIIIAAALGDASCGEEGATTVTFKDESISINGDSTATTLGTLAVVAGGLADMGLAKILLMLQIFNQEDVDADMTKYWAVNPKSISDMLDITEIGSADYNTVRALAQGKMESFAGFTWFWSNRITKDAASETGYRSICWAEDGIILGNAESIMSRFDELPEHSYVKQVYSEMSCGAVRMEGVKVHECLNKVA